MLLSCPSCGALYDKDGFYEAEAQNINVLYLCMCGTVIRKNGSIVSHDRLNFDGLEDARGLFICADREYASEDPVATDGTNNVEDALAVETQSHPIPVITADFGQPFYIKGLARVIVRRSDDLENGLYYKCIAKYFSFRMDAEGPHLRLIGHYNKYAFSGDYEKPEGPLLGQDRTTFDDVRYTLESAAEYAGKNLV
jgi:hypothetical protein